MIESQGQCFHMSFKPHFLRSPSTIRMSGSVPPLAKTSPVTSLCVTFKIKISSLCVEWLHSKKRAQLFRRLVRMLEICRFYPKILFLQHWILFLRTTVNFSLFHHEKRVVSSSKECISNLILTPLFITWMSPLCSISSSNPLVTHAERWPHAPRYVLAILLNFVYEITVLSSNEKH